MTENKEDTNQNARPNVLIPALAISLVPFYLLVANCCEMVVFRKVIRNNVL